MLDVDDALSIGRAIAAMTGEPSLTEEQEVIASVCERLLVEIQIARDEAEHSRSQLAEWGIPAKRRLVKKLEGKGFELGWE